MPREIEPLELNQRNLGDIGIVLNNEGVEPAIRENIFTFWDGLAYLDIRNNEVGYLESYDREKNFSTLERHLETEEIFFALDDAVMLAAPPTPDQSYPNPEEVKAFRVDAKSGILFQVGAWHWIPYPRGEKANFLVLFQRDTPDADLEKVDIKEEAGVSFELNM